MELFPVSIEALSGLVVRGPMFFQAKTVQIRKRIISPYHLIIMQMKKVFLSLLNVLIILIISMMGIGVECQYFYKYFIFHLWILCIVTCYCLPTHPGSLNRYSYNWYHDMSLFAWLSSCPIHTVLFTGEKYIHKP